jgi:TonB-linked SusC/RagA family outer membrane protein
MINSKHYKAMKKNHFFMGYDIFISIPKWLKIMKLLTFFLIIGAFQLTALNGYAQTKKLNLKIENSRLSEVFKAIEENSDFTIFYKSDDLELTPAVSLEVENELVTDALDKALSNTGLTYKIQDKVIVILSEERMRQQQEGRTVAGVVTDTSGDPVPGVNVFVKGTTAGTITDANGEYSIEVKRGDVLVFSFIGFESNEVIIADQNSINVSLEEASIGLDEVVAVAYSTQKKSNLTGSVASVSEEELADVSSPSVSNLLQGKAAGVYVVNSSGRPGSGGTIRIRGKGSLSSTQDPLWVIDGVVAGTGAQLSPAEIESISILKDASATALYGSRAANGVILVTTKRAKAGMNKFSASASRGVSWLNTGNFELMNSQQLYDYHQMFQNPDNLPTWWDPERFQNTNTDWFDLATQNGITQKYSLSYLGGSEKIQAAIIGNYYNETGTVKGYDYERFTTRANLDYKVNEKLSFSTKISGSYWSDDNQQHSLYQANLNLPWDDPYNEDGSIKTGKEEEWIGRDKSNYLYDLQWNWSRGKQVGIQGTFGMEYKITPWLTFTSNNNIGYRYHLTESYTDKRSLSGRDDNGSFYDATSLTTTRYTNQMLRFSKNFGGLHDVSAFGGYEFSDYRYEGFNATGKGLPTGFEVLDVTAEAKSVGGSKSENALQSLLFNANYVYDNRYMGQFSFRTDGSSRFSPDKRYANFFTFGVGWNIHRENFMNNAEWVDYLKIRASYGSVGNTPGASYGYLDVYEYTRQYAGIPAAFPQQMKNMGMTWEKAYSSNFAVDARFFNRLGVNFEVYSRNTSDLLHRLALSPLTGFSYQWINAGAIQNNGFELTLSPDIIANDQLTWSMDLNLGINNNEITELYDGDPIITGNRRYTEGYDMDAWYLRKWVGVDPENGRPLWEKEITDEEGNVTDVELTSDYNEATRQMIGKSSPDIFGGILNTISWKGFLVTANFSFVKGVDVYHSARQLFDSDGAYPTYNQMVLADGWSRWQQPGDDATHPKPVNGGNNDSNRPSSRYLEDGSFLRLRNLSLSYNVPQSVLDKLNLKGAQFSVSGENLWTLTDFSGYDPEVSEGSATGNVGASSYPLTQRIMFGLNLEF